MKKLIVVYIALCVSGGLAYAKHADTDLYPARIEQVATQPVAVLSLERAVEQKLEQAISVAELNRELESEIQDMMDDMIAELESRSLTQLDHLATEK